MLSTVLFDGLHGGQSWLLFEQVLHHMVPQWMDRNGYFAGGAGLIGVWLVFFTAYQFTCLLTATLARDARVRRVAQGNDRLHSTYGIDGCVHRDQPFGDR